MEGVVVEDVELDAGVGVEADAEMDVVEKDAVAMDAEGVVVGGAAEDGVGECEAEECVVAEYVAAGDEMDVVEEDAVEVVAWLQLVASNFPEQPMTTVESVRWRLLMVVEQLENQASG